MKERGMSMIPEDYLRQPDYEISPQLMPKRPLDYYRRTSQEMMISTPY
jgi:hypothetical protein